MNKTIKITEQDFLSYEAVRRSGVTNMWAMDTVVSLSGLSDEQVMEIMRNFSKYRKTYLEEIPEKVRGSVNRKLDEDSAQLKNEFEDII
jgi:hypothetical protein